MYSNFSDFLSQCQSYLDEHPETKHRLEPVVAILILGLDILISKTESVGFWAGESVVILEFLTIAPKMTVDFWKKAYRAYKHKKTIEEFLEFFESEGEELINKSLANNSWSRNQCQHN